MNRSLLRSIGRWLVGVVLIGQLAIAAHACPSWAQGSGVDESRGAVPLAASAAPALLGEHCDDPMGADDVQATNLCAEHCRVGDQGERPSALAVPAAWPVALYQNPPLPELPDRSRATWLSALVAASPPHAILHCVRRT